MASGETTALSLVLFLLAAVGFLCNGIVLLLALCSSRLRRPRHIPLFVCCATDVLGAGLWLFPMAVATLDSGQWNLGSTMCTAQPVFRVFSCTLAQLCLLAAIAERFLKLITPWRHDTAITTMGMSLLTFGMLLFSSVVAFFPLMSWGKVSFIWGFLQCTFDTAISLSHLNFVFIFTFVIPLVVCVVLMIITIYRVHKLRKNLEHGTALQRNEEIPRESYADKLRRQQARFKCAPMRGQRPGLRGSEHDVQNDGLVFSSYEEYEAYQRMLQQQRRVLRFEPQEYRVALMWWLATLVHFGLWLPWHVLTYVWTFTQVWSGSQAPLQAVAVLAAASVAYRPFLYLVSMSDFRRKPDGCRRSPKPLA